MADLVFVRANPNLPVQEGRAVTTIPSALPGSGSIYDVKRSDATENPTGQSAYAQNVLAHRFRNNNYYEGGAADNPDNPAQPTF